MIRKYLLIVGLLLAGYAQAQVPDFNFYHYSTANGVPSNAWQAVYRDSYGFLWLAAFDGLFRWDGYSFKKYEHSDQDLRSIDNNIVYTIFEDSRRRLWVGTISGLNLYDRTLDGFSKCNVRPNTPAVPVNAIREDSKHQLWLGTSYGLCRYDHDKRQSEWFTSGDDIVFCMTIDTADNIWTGSFNKGVRKFTQSSRSFQAVRHDKTHPAGLPSDKVTDILADSRNQIWVGTEDQGIVVLNDRGEAVKRFQSFARQSSQLRNNSISCLYEDSRRNIWIGVQRSLLYYIPGGAGEPRPVTNKAANNTRDNVMAVFSICEDGFGNTWFGTQGSGLFYTNRYKNHFRNYLRNDVLPAEPLARSINCFYEQPAGKVWLGTNGSGIWQFDVESKRFNRLTGAAALPGIAVTDICADKEGALWVSSWAAGVKRIDPATGAMRSWMHDANDPHSLPFNDVKAILPDDSLVWIGTHGEGLAVYHKRLDKIIHYKNNTLIPFDLHAPSWINHLFKDSKHRLWIGTYSGVFMFDGVKLHHYQHQADSTSISSNAVNEITEDASGQIWIISEGGLDALNERGNGFIRYAQRYQLSPVMKGIVSGRNSLLWIAGRDAVIAFDPRTGKVTQYDEDDGLLDDGFQKAILQTSDGELFTGGEKGFNVFHPDSLQMPAQAPYFYFTDLHLFNTLQQAGGDHSPLQRVLAFTDTLVLKYNQSFFSVGFTAINGYAPGKTKYSYSIDRLGDQWIDLRGERKVSFTNLQAGDYLLRIRYTNAEGQWLEAPRNLHITVLPPWWQTWWFRAVVLLLGLGVVLLLFYLRVAAIRKRNILLKEEVDRQTQELQHVNASLVEQRDEIKSQKENLEESNREVLRQSDKILEQQQHIVSQNQELAQSVSALEQLNQTKDHFFSILAHDLKNPVAALNDITGYVKQHLVRMERKELERYLDSMHNSSAAVYDLLINLLNWSRTQSRTIAYAPADVNLAELVDKNTRLMEQQFHNKHIQVQANVPAGYIIHADYHMVDTIIRNILSNGIKFTGYNGVIRIGAVQQNGLVELSIADNGVGMTEAQQLQLFNINSTIVSAGTAGEKGTGLGLVITKEFVDANKGSIRVASAPGKGTTFYIVFPASATQPAVDAAQQNSGGKLIVPAQAATDFWDEYPVEKLLKIKGRKVLIVEDNREVRDYLKLILSDTFEIFEAGNGQEGLTMVIELQPAVVISDLLMPGMNGLDFCRALKNGTATSHVPVIILTSQWEDELQTSGYEAGADVYLTKPVKKELLIQVVLNLLQKQEKLQTSIREQMEDDAPFQAEGLSLSKSDEEFLSRMVQYIEAHISDTNLDARVLSKELATSRSILYTKVKSLTGQTVHEFIKSIRLKRSLRLLLEGDVSISQVAIEVGFNSHSYFDKCFLKQYKMGPKEYVNRKRGKG